MGENSDITWTDATFNPWWGCTKVSPACDGCYAETFATRMGFRIWGQGADRRFFGEKHWGEPLKWNRTAASEGVRKRVFCASMADVMEDRRELDEHRTRLWKVIEQTPHLDWLLLTKRPQCFHRLLPSAWLFDMPSNIWGMTTVESDEYRWRIEELLKLPFTVHGISAEPLVGPLDISHYLKGEVRLAWVVTGGESGTKARPAHPQWFTNLRDQCIAAEVPFHFKQWGQWPPCGPIVDAPEFDGGRAVETASGGLASYEHFIKTGRFHDFGDGVVVERVKDKHGRVLDGRVWDEFPKAVPRA